MFEIELCNNKIHIESDTRFPLDATWDGDNYETVIYLPNGVTLTVDDVINIYEWKKGKKKLVHHGDYQVSNYGMRDPDLEYDRLKEDGKL